MSFLRNLLALFGILVIAVVVTVVVLFGSSLKQIQSLDPEAPGVYLSMMQKVLETGNGAEATVWKRKVNDGLSVEDVDVAMKFVANEHNIKNVGELPLSKQVEAMTGQPYRFMKIYMFCNALTAAKMIDYSDAYSAYLPCRVTLLEDQQGQLWIYTLNMDMMIYGGKTLPPDLYAEAVKVKEIILDIMERGAKGEF
jgi:hypothetical protein